MKKILMIHEIRPWMLDLDLSDFDILTFDDGLYSQYVYYKHFLKYDKPMMFFISTGIICPENVQQNEDFPICSDAHQLFFKNGISNNYMKWSQIKEISSTDGCEIGGHSHNHKRLRHIKIKPLYDILKYEINTMMTSFSEQGISIDSFCFPYNEDYIFYKLLLEEVGIKTFFGAERIDIETLKS
jgi:hypothetical protein